MTSVLAEYNEISEKSSWEEVYQNIKEASEVYEKENNYTVNEAKKIQNKRLNRYRDVLPYDHSRVILNKKGLDIDYINANLVKSEQARRRYILCQGPLEITTSHFWLMVWEQQSRAILMLNKIIEKEIVKCHRYWPKEMGYDKKLLLNDVGLTVEYIKVENYKHFSKRTFRLTDIDSTKSREILQYHYTTWPDFGVPCCISFLQFLKQVRDAGVLEEDVGPPVIHCSAGIGRSGTFCLVDCCLVLIDKEGENRISVKNVLIELRKYRMGLIQTSEQLKFSYEAIIEGMKRINNDTFMELDVLEKATVNSDADDDEIVPPPLPPRSTSCITTTIDAINNMINRERSHNHRPPPLLPTPMKNKDSDEDSIEDECDDIDNDSSSDELTDNSDYEHINEDNTPNFNANATLPPIPTPNGTLDLTGSPDQYMSSSDDDKNNRTEKKSPESELKSELRYRNRVARQDAMQDKIREIKRKQQEVEDKKSTMPKKRRSIILSVVAGVIISAVFAYVYSKS